MKLPNGSVLVRHRLFPEFDKVTTSIVTPPDCKLYKNQDLHKSQFVDNRALFRSKSSKGRKKGITWGGIKACYNVRIPTPNMVGMEPKLFYKTVLLGGQLGTYQPSDVSGFFFRNVFDKCTVNEYTFPSHTILNIATRGSTIVFKNCTFKKNVFIHSDVKYTCVKCTGSPIPYNYIMFKDALKHMGLLNAVEDNGDFTIYTLLRTVYAAEIRNAIKASETAYFFLADVLHSLAAGRTTIRQSLLVRNKELKHLCLCALQTGLKTHPLQTHNNAIIARAVINTTLEPVALRTLLPGNEADLGADITYCGHIGTKMILSDGILFATAVVEPIMQKYQTTEIVIQNSVVSVPGLIVMLAGLQEPKPVIVLKNCICINSQYCTSTPEPGIVYDNCEQFDLAELLNYGLSYNAKLLLAVHHNCPYMQNTITDVLKLEATQGIPEEPCDVWPEITFPFTKKGENDEQRTD